MKRKVASFHKKRVIIYEKKSSPSVNIEFNLKYIKLEIPEGLSYRKVFARHYGWLTEKLEMLNHAKQLSKSMYLYSRTVEDFKILVRSRVSFFSTLLHVPVRRINIRYMKTKWGSWTSKGTLTLNLFLRFLPDAAIDYVIVHELAHYYEPEHSESFYRILESCMANFGEFEKILFAYWLKLDCEGIVDRFVKNRKCNFC